jgi:uncharacterized membrane protein (UPF0127 family)
MILCFVYLNWKNDPIDVISLDRAKKMIDIKLNRKPFAIYISKKKARQVVECSAGTIRKIGTESGDHIVL